ncbi:MAG: MFS transporter [Rhodospirillaceae bacterium]|jgi:MFS family permease|nr:MFS transporter [Rhodospirillaceae bacterium]MBT3886199.1 MFS transporter [Rhodospirillaceae bacterium]MBT4116714.1 MFS transporter [Rhodospirillaceae bacterium]MBT4671697.1 MFS transporter [Rhodospirillaceae bacterium]MBT4722057.1 MFS transporter [Rhodospirillaceae bacterium]
MTDNTDIVPAHAYRWVIVGVSAILMAFGIGVISAGITAFIIPLNQEFGWPRGSISFINTAGLVGVALGGVVMGRFADRTSARRIALIGAVSLGISLLAAARADTLWQFYGLFFVAGFLGAASLFTPLVANVGNWFTHNVGLALGIASAGQALGQGGVPFASALFISEMGWRGAFTALGTITLILLVPLCLLIRQPPKADPALADTSPAVEDIPVPFAPNTVIIWLSAAVVCCCITMSVPLMHVVPLAQDRGIGLNEAASIVFVMMLAGVVGRVAFGRLADMIGPVRSYLVASGWQTVMVFAFLQLDTLDGFYLFGAIYGFGYSGVMTSILVCVRMLTPAARRASAFGIVTMFGWLGHGIGGYQGGYFFDLTGSYTISYANAAFAGIVNLVIVGALFVTLNRRRAALAVAG